MTTEGYTNMIELPIKWADSREMELAIKAAILRTIRIVLNDPEQAKKYYDCQPMATMDNVIVEGAECADNHPKSPWISSKEKLPTKGGHYLCMDDNHNIVSLAFVGDKWFNSRTFADVPLDVVIYWMPIPDLPKE